MAAADVLPAPGAGGASALEGGVSVSSSGGSALPATGVYRTRFWIGGVYTLLAFTQGYVWAIPGPISGSLIDMYGISATMIELLVNYGPIMYLVSGLFVAAWLDRPAGAPQTMRYATALVLLGGVARCAAVDDSATSVALLHVGYMLNALAGPVAMGAVGRITEDWFPPAERATATAIMTEANVLGGAVAYFGVLAVTNDTFAELQGYNYGVLALCALLAAAAFAHFPARPPLPPSLSAAHARAQQGSAGAPTAEGASSDSGSGDTVPLLADDDSHGSAPSAPGAAAPLGSPTIGASLREMGRSFAAMGRNVNFLVLVAAYGLPTGMLGVWNTLLTVNLSGLDLPNYSPVWAAAIGLVGTITGNIGGIVMGRVADRFHRLQKPLVLCMAVATVAFLGFAILCAPGVVAASVPADLVIALLFLTGCVGGLALTSTLPLFFELALEVTHPLPEGAVIIALTAANNIGALAFLAVPVSSAGTAWMNWLFAGTVLAFTVILQFVFKEKALRYTIDAGTSHKEDRA